MWICPICDTPEYNIKLCKCFPETSYNITLQSADSMNYNLCVHDVQHIMNGIYIHLYQDHSSCLSTVSNVPLPPIYRLYVASYRIDVSKLFRLWYYAWLTIKDNYFRTSWTADLDHLARQCLFRVSIATRVSSSALWIVNLWCYWWTESV